MTLTNMPGNSTFFSFFLFAIALSNTALGQDKPTAGTGGYRYRQEMSSLQKAIDRNFYDSAAGFYKEWPGNDQPRHPYTYLWSLCALFQADNEIEKLEPGAKLLQPLLSMIHEYEDPAPPQPGFADYIRKFSGGERYYDDNQWLGITALDAYARTKDRSYLSLGREIYTFMMTGYDTVLTGGLYWKENKKTSKNTCSNGPGILVALQLYAATKNRSYLDTALLLYHWVNSRLKAPSGLYYDNITTKGRISQPILSYNTGTMLESNLYLYECTHDRRYLQEATAIADSSLPYFYGGTRFRDAYWFNAVLLRGYQHLLKYNNDTKYILAFQKCLDYALQNQKNQKGLFVENDKALDLVAHGGMLEMLARFAWMEEKGILATPIPHLEKRGTATQLIVDGKPFLVLGGELHNSSSSSLDYLAPILTKFAAEHLNTALCAVAWDLMEPEEGKFDFSLIDGAIEQARRNNLRLVLLWFGSWKNGVSTYPPLWVKKDLRRFPRAQNKDGMSLDILSTFSKTNRDADANAFAALLEHVRAVDGEAHTVIMIQVENEVGILTETRDRSAAANEAFKRPVPGELIDYLKKHKDELSPGLLKEWQQGGEKTSGNWEEIFGVGDATDELFMAWNYACYVGKVAAAGKTRYPLPLFVNTWLAEWRPTAPMKPGVYPSGGPLPYVMDIWKAGAPQIDILSPDIYSFFEERAALYHRPDNPLFIPELVRETRTCSAIFYGLGQFDAIGFSPFGMESLPDFSAELAKTYEVLAKIAPTLLDNQGKGRVGGAFLDKDHPTQSLPVGDYTLNLGIAHHYSFPTPEYPAGIFIQTGPDEYLVAGRGLTITFTPNTPGDDPTVGIASVEDGDVVNGRWVPGRRLNGDEILSGKGLRLRGDYYMIQRVKLYRYR